jgi:hypothetical protein
MPETITVHDDLEIIEVHSFGQVTKQDLLQSLQAVDQIYQTRGYNKVLIDAQEEEGIPNAIDLFMFGDSMGKAYVSKTGRFAVVTSEATRKDLEFLAKTSQDRGMKVDVFMSVDEAIDWLNGKTTAE